MPRAATDVMQSIIFSAIVDAVEALRAASKGVPNTLLRDLQSVHRNTTFADLPKELQDSIMQSVRAAFTQLLKDGYSVAPRDAAPQVRRPPPRHDAAGARRGPGPDRRPPRGGGGGAAPPKGPPGEGGGPGKGPGNRPRRPPKGKPRLS
jgi:hypothetical protein